MFIKTTKSKNYTYLQLVESYREGKVVKHRVLYKLGRLDQLKDGGSLAKLARRLLELAGERSLAPDDLKEISRHVYGHIVYQRLWEKLEIAKILTKLKGSKLDLPVNDIVFYLCINRLLCPSSKKKAFEMSSTYLGMGEFKLHQVYRSLDFLSNKKEELETLLFKKQMDLFHMKLDMVFYDVTTFHFESQKADELKDFGFSKANKINEVQVVLGLLVNRDGRPIGYELFEGNTFEGRTMVKALALLKQRFQIGKVVIVADKGMHSKGNLHLIKQAGYDYIVSSRLKTATKKIKEELFNPKDFINTVDQDTGEISYAHKDIENRFIYKDESGKKHEHKDRLMVSWSAPRAINDSKKRKRLWERAEQQMADGKKALVNNKGAARYIKKDGKTQAVGLDQDKFTQDGKWDGYYAVQYSGKQLSHHEAMEQYHRLWKIEECFRIMKTTMQTRPIFHWTPKRVKGHFVLCFIAFLLERTLELKLAKNKLDLSPQKIKEALNSLQVSKVDIAGQEFYMKGKNNKDAAAILRKMKIKQPKNITPIADFKLI